MPRADLSACSKVWLQSFLLNDLIGEGEQCGRDCEAEGLGGPEVDREIEFGSSTAYWRFGWHGKFNTVT